jgi:hypothetical protein
LLLGITGLLGWQNWNLKQELASSNATQSSRFPLHNIAGTTTAARADSAVKKPRPKPPIAIMRNPRRI